MPIAKNSNNDINQIGMLAALATYNRSTPGKWTASVIPTVNNATISVINILIPTMIRTIPISFAKAFRKNIRMFPMESKKVCELDFKRLPCF